MEMSFTVISLINKAREPLHSGHSSWDVTMYSYIMFKVDFLNSFPCSPVKFNPCLSGKPNPRTPIQRHGILWSQGGDVTRDAKQPQLWHEATNSKGRR